MTAKIKVAINWAGACGGCDVAILDSEDKLLELAEVAEIVYWPVAMDFKRDALRAFGSKQIDVGIFNGVIRTSEHEEDARLLRDRCKVLIAFGACAALGGIPGLANLSPRQALLDRVYRDTPSTDNLDDLRPQTSSQVQDHTLELPAFHHTVKALPHVVDVDYVVPGCPPPPAQVLDALRLIINFANGGELPPAGAVLGSAKALCDECPRIESRTASRLGHIHRTHQVAADPDRCFLEQGLLCLGLATRGGCGALCIGVNAPCRGCFGPTDSVLDPGAETISAVASIASLENEDDLLASKRNSVVRSIADVAGTFYRFSLPSAILFGTADDTAQE